MAQRLKLPAYAKSLLENRRRGFHPLEVEVVYGFDWTEARVRSQMETECLVKFGDVKPYGRFWAKAIGRPMIVMSPRDYSPGAFDFRCLAGVCCYVIDQVGGAADVDFGVSGDWRTVTRWGRFYDLLAELSAFAPVVYVVYADGSRQSVETLAWLCRSFEAGSRRMVWPRWWNDALEKNVNDGHAGLMADYGRAIAEMKKTDAGESRGCERVA